MIQQLLMRFAGTLNRRRAYAPTHPMVLAAEEQLLEQTQAALAGRSTLSIGVAHHELLIDGEPHDTKSGYARELATRLHRRGVGAITFESGLTLEQLRAALGWLAMEPDGSADAAPVQNGVHITRIAYDHLVLDDAIRDAESAVASLWRTLAELAEFGVDAARGGASASRERSAESTASPADRQPSTVGADGISRFADAGSPDGSGYDTDAILAMLRTSLQNPAVARRTAVALLELTNHGVTAIAEGRELIGRQLLSMLDRLGTSAFGPIVRSLTDRAMRQRFVTQVVDVLPIDAAVTWLNAAASASQQNLSHQMLRIMTKLSTLATDRGDAATESTFREAAHDLVNNWELADPNPSMHVELLDRIANFERAHGARFNADIATVSSIVESARVVQMALEMDFGGEDTVAAAEALIAEGAGRQLMQWIADAGNTATATWLRQVATSDRAVRQLLLTEPVDRLEARALLEVLDASSADTLLDVLAESGTRGTRLIVRQRLSELGEAITGRLLARLEAAPWYLVRNILTLLHDAAVQRGGAADAGETIVQLIEHPQVQVRVEALRLLLLSDASARDSAIRRALRDDNERMVVVALQALADASETGARLPTHIVTQLMALVDDGAQSEPIRARAVRTMAYARTDAVRDWLLSHVVRRTKVLRRLILIEPTPVTVSALQVLLRNHPDDPAVVRVQALARRDSTDARWQMRDLASSAERAT